MPHNSTNELPEDESGLEQDAPIFPDIEIPFDPSKIDIQVKIMTIGSLLSRLENNELDLTPDFQRQANVWDAKRKGRLIESVLLRIPLPSFYFSEDENGTYSVVDGLQRLCTLFHFIDFKELNRVTGTNLKPLQLTDLQYLKELEEFSYLDLDRKLQRRVGELEITANIIRATTPPAVKFNVFARLNQGGMPLNSQEIRNAIYPGVWRVKLQYLAKSRKFLEVTEGKIKTERQQDLELILRFVALWDLGPPFLRPANQTLDDFLNDAVEKSIRHWNEEKWNAASNAFERALSAASKIFGRHVFRKSIGWIDRSPINRGLFESKLVILTRLSDADLLWLQTKKNMVTIEFKESLGYGSPLSNSLLYATGSSGSSNTRIKEINRILTEVIDA